MPRTGRLALHGRRLSAVMHSATHDGRARTFEDVGQGAGRHEARGIQGAAVDRGEAHKVFDLEVGCLWGLPRAAYRGAE